jgi:hypothetical protein
MTLLIHDIGALCCIWFGDYMYLGVFNSFRRWHVSNGYLTHLEILVILQLNFYTRFKVVHLDVDIKLIFFCQIEVLFCEEVAWFQ